MTTSTTPQIQVPPPGILDQKGFVHLPIRIADYTSRPSYEPSLMQKLRDKTAKKADQEPQMIAMTQEQYLQYWQKDDSGNFAYSVQEPPEGRVEWLRHQLRVNEQWREWGTIRNLAGGPYASLYW